MRSFPNNPTNIFEQRPNRAFRKVLINSRTTREGWPASPSKELRVEFHNNIFPAANDWRARWLCAIILCRWNFLMQFRADRQQEGSVIGQTPGEAEWASETFTAVTPQPISGLCWLIARRALKSITAAVVSIEYDGPVLFYDVILDGRNLEGPRMRFWYRWPGVVVLVLLLLRAKLIDAFYDWIDSGLINLLSLDWNVHPISCERGS